MYEEYEIKGTYLKDGKEYPDSTCTFVLNNNRFKKNLIINNYLPEDDLKKVKKNIPTVLGFPGINNWDEDIIVLNLDYSLEEIKEELLTKFNVFMYREINNFKEYSIRAISTNPLKSA